MVPSIYGILVLILAFAVSAEGMIYLAVIATLFGATAAFYATALGGANITPAVVIQVFVAWRILRRDGFTGLLAPMSFLKPGFWLLLLTSWGAISAIALPRFFEGQFMVNTLDRDSAVLDGLKVIGPVSMNITQAMYAALALFTFVAMRATLQRPKSLQLLAKAVLWLAGLNVLAASMDLAQYHLGMPPILFYIKNGNYALGGGEVAGLMRIAGTFAETSAFSQFTLAILAFTHTLWINKVYAPWSGVLSVSNLGMLMISTSGTAYVGLAVCFAMALAFSCWYFMRHGGIGKYSIYIWIAVIGAIAGAAILLFVPPAMGVVSDYFGVVIGKKVNSQSGVVRFGMNMQAIQNFGDTFGLGTGLGSNRASSFALVLLSNLGWIGVVFFGVFIGSVLMGKGRNTLPPNDAVVVLAARHAVLTTLVAACISGMVYDLGVLFYIMAAAAVVPPSLSMKAAQRMLVDAAPQQGRSQRLTGLS